MAGLHNLKPGKVIRAFEKAGWVSRRQRGSHVKLTKEGNPNKIWFNRGGISGTDLGGHKKCQRVKKWDERD